jgi:MerR family copper efflux transcriptional regulator
MANSRAPLRSGAIAKLTGISSDTLRYYEREGLLPRPPRDPNGYRRYPSVAVDRVRVIQRALDAGFTVAELRRVFRQRDAGGVPCNEVLSIARARLTELDSRIDGLLALRDDLKDLVSDWASRVASTAPGKRAGLLDGLAQAPARGSHALRRPPPKRRSG